MNYIVNIKILFIFVMVLLLSACIKPTKIQSNPSNLSKPLDANKTQELLVSISKDPLQESLEKVLDAFVMYGKEIKGFESEVYVLERKSIAKTILANQDDFILLLNLVLENDHNNLLQLVDKKHFLDKTDNPIDLVPLKPNDAYLLNRNDLSLRVPVEAALRKMSLEAKSEGITIVASSTYRSYEYQEALFERNVKELGVQEAERESARAGTSQHQLGTVVDFGSITDDFALTKAGIWLDKNASRFGFSLSFPQGYEEITGYRWECWHYRYIGVEACALQEKYFQNIQQYMMEFLHLWKLNK